MLTDLHPFEDAFFGLIGLIAGIVMAWRFFAWHYPARGPDGRFVKRD